MWQASKGVEGRRGERRRVGAGGGNTALSFLLFHFAFFSVNENRQWATSSKQDLEQGGKRKDLRSFRQQAMSVPQLNRE